MLEPRYVERITIVPRLFMYGTNLLFDTERSGMYTLSNVKAPEGENSPSCVRSAPGAIPEAKSSKTGASVRYVQQADKKWFVFRVSYGRISRVADYMIEDGAYAYVAKRYSEKWIKGRKKRVLVPLIPNLLFAYITDEKAKEYITATPALSFLSYY